MNEVTDGGVMTMTYTAPDGTVTVRRLPMDRWDDIHDRLEAQGMCKPWDAVQERVWRALLRSDERRRAS